MVIKPRKKNRPNKSGRNTITRFAKLDFRILYSNAYRSLTPTARALLVELAMLENGSNNGSLYLSIRDAAGRLGLSDLNAARAAFDDLLELGFIEMTEAASFHVKASEKSRARCWRLTWLSGPGRKLPSMAFMEREPEPGTKAYKRMERGLRALKAYRRNRDFGRLPVLDSETLEPQLPVLQRNTYGKPIHQKRQTSEISQSCLCGIPTHIQLYP